MLDVAQHPLKSKITADILLTNSQPTFPFTFKFPMELKEFSESSGKKIIKNKMTNESNVAEQLRIQAADFSKNHD